MKKFKDLIEESPAKDYVGDGESQKDYEAAGSDEQRFKDLHFTHNAHLVQPKGHPVTPDYVFTGERPGGKKGHEGEDHKGSTKVPGETILKTYKDFVASGKSLAGDQAPVMQGSSKVKEEVELDEAFKAGKIQFKDGKYKVIDAKTAEILNNAMNELNTTNRKRMETEAMKDTESFEAMLKFAKAAV